MSQSIIDFFAERKAAWLKAKFKPSIDDSQRAQILQEAENKFSLAAWLPDAAKRASQLLMVSHPSKFSHPSAKTSSVIVKGQPANDGYIRSGNVEYELDIFGNAAAMDVYKFLILKMTDGQTVLTHLEADSDAIKSILTIPTASYDELKQGLISIKQLGKPVKTDALVKQVYFPLNSTYHLLSILTASGLITKLKTRIDTIRFSDQTKEAKDYRKRNEYHSLGYDDVLNLTVTAYGGTQPQNISVLNSRNAGRAYLLPSVPPTIKKRQIRLPKYNFFKNSLRIKDFQESFQSLHKLIRCDLNNIKIRTAIENTIKFIIDQVLAKAFKVRIVDEEGWSDSEYYSTLPLAQRIWLDNIHLTQRQDDEDWIEDISRDFARWILYAYETSLKNEHITLGDGELNHLRDFTEKAVSRDKEYFK